MVPSNLKYLFNILMTIAFVEASAQQDVKLPGVVVEQNSKLKSGQVVYVQGANIKAIQATPQMSDARGRFTLVFADMPPGNVAQIDVGRDGYEVVNSKVLQAAAITGRNAPLEIVMCKAGLLYDNQVLYYDIATDATRQLYEKKLKILEQGGKNKDALIAQLQKEMNRVITSKEEAVKSLKEQNQFQQSQSLALANKFVTINLDDESETYQRAFKAFESKDVGKAISLIDSVNLESRLNTNVEELRKEEASGNYSPQNIEKRKLQIKQDISQCMFKARLHILLYDYTTARQSYLLALQYDSTNTENLLEAGSFFLNQNETGLAKKYFDQLLSFSRTDYAKAIALADIGNSYKNIGAYEEAEKYYPLSVKILSQLYAEYPAEYRLALTDVLNRLGTLYFEWEFYSIAGRYLDEADDIYSKSYDSLSNNSIPDAENLIWFDILYNKSSICYVNANYYGAERLLDFQAIPVLEKVIKRSPSRYADRLGRALYKQGLCDFYLKDYETAGSLIRDGIGKIRELAERRPDQYSGDLADMLTGLGNLCYHLKSYGSAEEFYFESLKVIRPLPDKNSSDQDLSYFAATLSGLANLCIELKQYNQAAELCGEALKIQVRLAAKNPVRYSRQLAFIYHVHGRLQFNFHNYQKAEEGYDSALEKYKNLEEKNPEIYLTEKAGVLYDLGLLNFELKKYDMAEQYYLEAMGITIRIIKTNKDALDRGILLENLSFFSKMTGAFEDLYRNWQGTSKARQSYSEMKNEYLPIEEKNRPKASDSVVMLNNLGKFFYDLEIYTAAEQSFTRAINQFLALSAEEQTLLNGFNIASVSVNLLNVYQMELETTKDFSYRDKAIKFIGKAKEWNERDPTAYDYSYNKKRLDEFDAIFKNVTTKDLNVTTFYLDDIENKLNSIGQEKDTIVITTSLEKIIKELESKRIENSQNQRMNSYLAQAYGSLAWFCVFKKENTKTINFAQKGIALDSTQTWIYSNLALGYLLSGKWPEAKKIYGKYKDVYQDEFLKDLHDLREAGIVVPQMREAEEFILK
jgi:tetratricopeptide (TPR) repeat protein